MIHCKWLKGRDVLCSCHLQIMDLSYDVGRRQCGLWGMLLVHWMHVYVKVNLIMLIQKEHGVPKQARQPGPASICAGYSERKRSLG